MVASALVALAVEADGYSPVQLDLNDAGVWATDMQLGAVGRVNTEIHLVDTRVAVPSPVFDVLQSGSNVLVDEAAPARLLSINVATANFTANAALPSGAQVALGGDTGSVLAGSRLWIAAGEGVAAFNYSKTPPSARVNGVAALVVDDSGTVDVLAEDGTISRWAPDGRGLRPERLDEGSAQGTADIELSAVGSEPVALAPATDQFLVPGRAPLKLRGYGKGLVIQQPGPSSDDAIVATGSDLLAVPLSGGAPKVLWAHGGGDASSPVWLSGCAYGAWQAHPSFAQICGGQPTEAGYLSTALPTQDLRYRVNRARVVLNDIDTGDNLVFGVGAPEAANDWSQAEQVASKAAGLQVAPQPVAGQKQIDLSAPDRPPVALAVRAATQPGQPVIIEPLEADSSPNGDMLVIEPLVPLPPGEGAAAVIDNGQEIQYEPTASFSGPVTFPYTINDGRGGQATANIVVNSVPVDANSPPAVVPQSVVDGVGLVTTTNVLDADSDPDGDAFLLSGARASTGVVQWVPSGQISYTPPGNFVGTAVVTYTASAEYGASSTGRLYIYVRPAAKLVPVANDAYAGTLVGQATTVDLTPYVTDPSGAPVTLTNVSHLPAGAQVSWSPDGVVHFQDATAGDYEMLYEVSNGMGTDDAVLRVDVLATSPRGAPAAVRDDILVRAGTPTLVDVTANDVDPSGNVLLVQSVTVPPASGLTVQILDRHILRVSDQNNLTGPVEFTYLESDGVAQAVGTVIAQPAPSATIDQAPLTVPQTATVRAGTGIVIPVLDADVDPQGEAMRVVSVAPLVPGAGSLFVDGNEVGYTAPLSGASTVTGFYTVADTDGNRSTGEVTLHVVPAAGAANLAPDLAPVVARTFSGEDVTIQVPLGAVPPDGDLVSLVGLVQPPSAGTIIATGTDSFIYRPDQGATGTDRFTYQVRDQFGATGTGTVEVAVVPPPAQPEAPVAVASQASVKPGATVSIPVLANDSDPLGGPLSLVEGAGGLTRPRIGNARVAGTVVEYTAPPGVANGTTVSFDYTVVDALGNQSTASVTVTITAAPPPVRPIAVDDLVAPEVAGTEVQVDVLAKDSDPAGRPGDLTVTVPAASLAKVTATQEVRFLMPNHPVALQYEVTNPPGLSANAMIEVPLAGPALPVLPLIQVETIADRAVTVPVLAHATDPSGTPLHVVGIAGQRHGAAVVTGKQITFTPDPSYTGDAGFSYSASDGRAAAVGSVLVEVAKNPILRSKSPAVTVTTTACCSLCAASSIHLVF